MVRCDINLILTVLVSGNNFFGQLGVDHLKTVYDPVRLNFSFDSQIVEVVASQYHTLFLTVKGTVYVAGNNYYSQMSIKDSWVLTPTIVEELEEIHHIYSGLRFTIFHTHDGKLLLNGDIEESNCPVNRFPIYKEDPNDTIRKVSCGDCHFIILTHSGRVFVYGRNYSGALGLGHTNDVFDQVIELNYKEILKTEATIVDVQCGESHTVFKTREGQIFGCGFNNKHQLIARKHPQYIIHLHIIPKITDLGISKYTKNRVTEVRCGRECTVFLTGKLIKLLVAHVNRQE